MTDAVARAQPLPGVQVRFREAPEGRDAPAFANTAGLDVDRLEVRASVISVPRGRVLLPQSSVQPTVAAEWFSPWRGERVSLIQRSELHPAQELDNSCVPAATRNLLYILTGELRSESDLRVAFARAHEHPEHDWSQEGTDPGLIVGVLRDFGVAAMARSRVSLDELERLAANGRPLLIGIRRPFLHRLMIDSVGKDDQGRTLFYLRNTKGAGWQAGTGQRFSVTALTRRELADVYNPAAVVIIPL